MKIEAPRQGDCSSCVLNIPVSQNTPCLYHNSRRTKDQKDEFERWFSERLTNAFRKENRIEIVGLLFDRDLILDVSELQIASRLDLRDCDFTSALTITGRTLCDIRMLSCDFHGGMHIRNADLGGLLSFQYSNTCVEFRAVEAEEFFQGEVHHGSEDVFVPKYCEAQNSSLVIRNSQIARLEMLQGRWNEVAVSDSNVTVQARLVEAISQGDFDGLALLGRNSIISLRRYFVVETGTEGYETTEVKWDPAISFINCAFSDTTFIKIEFGYSIAFLSTDLSQTKFVDVTFIENGNEHLTANYLSYIPETGLMDATRSEENIRQIRHAYERSNSYSQAGDFYVLEMDLRLARTKSFWANLYKMISNFGESYTKPILLLVCAGPVFTVVHSIILEMADMGRETISISNLGNIHAWSRWVLGTSEASLLTLLSHSYRALLFQADPNYANPIVSMLTVIESVVGLVLLANIAIALRRRFMR